MNVEELIAALKLMPPKAIVYFDRPGEELIPSLYPIKVKAGYWQNSGVFTLDRPPIGDSRCPDDTFEVVTL